MSNDEIEKDIMQRTGFQDPNINSQAIRKDMNKAQKLIKQSLKKYESEYFSTFDKRNHYNTLNGYDSRNCIKKSGVTNQRMDANFSK